MLVLVGSLFATSCEYRVTGVWLSEAQYDQCLDNVASEKRKALQARLVELEDAIAKEDAKKWYEL